MKKQSGRLTDLDLTKRDPDEEARKAATSFQTLDRRIGGTGGAGGYSHDDAAYDARKRAEAHNLFVDLFTAATTPPERAWVYAWYGSAMSSPPAAFAYYLIHIEPTQLDDATRQRWLAIVQTKPNPEQFQ